ncbi:hypothetical protein [Acidovorax sp.]|uniref:hypothetical protein n=1 Tax=Acidovorax sp. TaxID=1872122 RepID=UPI0025C3D20C|nr:hypothetical protein [Acidovorax sp.]MBW8463685.1 hypothetical protein [Acidovorax sp.]
MYTTDINNTERTATVERRVRKAVNAAELQLFEAKRLAVEGGFGTSPELVAALVQAISINYAALVTEPKG